MIPDPKTDEELITAAGEALAELIERLAGDTRVSKMRAGCFVSQAASALVLAAIELEE